MFVTELKPGQTVIVGGARITLRDKVGKKAKLAIDANDSVKIEIERSNKCRSDKQDAKSVI